MSLFTYDAPLTSRDFYRPKCSSVTSYHRRITSRIIAKFVRLITLWSLAVVMAAPLTITKVHA